mmetsp:Transcript_6487/g.11591  ORF Transcript_6487/g.11591 Transcript_6487/m.11591 type:complete len:362 (-) Transcript_6487:1859-2944(-)
MMEGEKEALVSGDSVAKEVGDEVEVKVVDEDVKVTGNEEVKEDRTFNSSNYMEWIEKLTPLMLFLGKVLDTVGPLIGRCVAFCERVYVKLEPYHPDEWLPMIYGLLLVFFGGTYMMTLAAIEAFSIFGWARIEKSLGLLWENLKDAKAASDADDLLDENADGIPDVLQISKRELVTRKMQVFLIASDPEEVAEGMSGLAAGCLAVLATLRERFAQAIALGIAVGDRLDHLVTPLVLPGLLKLTDEKYHKWVPIGISYGFRFIGVWIGLFTQRFVAEYYAALRGSEMFLAGLISYITRNKYVKKQNAGPGSFFFTIGYLIIAFFGMWWQFTNLFQIPFPLNILLLPLTILENLLVFCVAIMH